MGELIKADFKTKLNSRLRNFNPKDPRPEYHAEIFSELFTLFPQFKAHVAAYVERNYCVAVNDEDHADPRSLLQFLKPQEVRVLNEWIAPRGHLASLLKSQ
ncbi:MAG: hypothetical protein JSU88_02265 [Nitrospinaceae bacterium]|nr:MAG: hypothetical protein JSU88_02265 [Nitrospinaceae bacterium]